MRNKKVLKLTMVGLLTAMVFVSNFLSVPIPLGLDNTRIHFGNVFCLLAGLLAGPVSGGLAAGLGSAIYDLTNPLYITSAPFTFVFKFMLAYVCGRIAHKNTSSLNDLNVDEENLPTINIRRYFVAGIMGSLTYIILYLSKGFITSVFIQGIQVMPALVTTGQKAIASVTNGIIAVVVSIPIYLVLRKSLQSIRSDILETFKS